MKGADGRAIYRPAQQPSLAADVQISYAKAGLLALLLCRLRSSRANPGDIRKDGSAYTAA